MTADGCFAIELSTVRFPADPDAGTDDAGVEDLGNVDDEAREHSTEYICAAQALPFSVGDEVAVTVGRIGTLSIESRDAALQLLRHNSGTTAGLTTGFSVRTRCDFFVEEDCARVGRVGYLDLQSDGDSEVAQPGQPAVKLDGSSYSALVTVTAAEDLVLLDTACARVARFQTNSPVSRALASVSFVPVEANPMIGGR